MEVLIFLAALVFTEACWIEFPDQGLNPSLLRWKRQDWPLDHQGSPSTGAFIWKEGVSARWPEQPCEGHVHIWRKSLPGRRNSECKGPGVDQKHSPRGHWTTRSPLAKEGGT